jgi:hypothetical protein
MRRRRPLYLALLMLLLTACAVVGGLISAVKREPAFYTEASRAGDVDTLERSSKLLTRAMDLRDDVYGKAEWGDAFTADDLNAFFIENMGPKGQLTENLPKGFHSPRVSIRGDRLFIGMKYRDGFWSTVVWLELKVWLVAEQTNVAVVEVCSFQAGRLPFGAQSILDQISELARKSSIDVTWYRLKNNPVGLFKFFAKQPQATAQVLTLEITDGKLVVAGRSDASPGRDVGQPAPAGVKPIP